MAPPKTRVRKFHKRSKNGCNTCKTRHVRCDERRPLCTSCLQHGDECVYLAVVDTPSSASETASVTHSEPASGSIVTVLPNDALTGYSSDYQLSSKSRWLFHQFVNFYVRGQTAVERGPNICAVQRALMHPGLLHGCLVIAACQWGWVTGSLDNVKMPFLHHKAAAYEFAKDQIADPKTATNTTTLCAIATLALAEGAVGDLDASSKHLRGIRKLTSQRNGYKLMRINLAQQMLEMAGERLRKGKHDIIYEAMTSDYQPTVIALLFISLWDISSLPPKKAPKYGWWQASETPTDRLWQDSTKNLDYEITRDFDPNRNIPDMLNHDSKSSRTSYIATFFYLIIALQDSEMDCVLTAYLLEQLTDDLAMKEADMLLGTFSRHLWLWSVLFGAAVAATANPVAPQGITQMGKWKRIYADKMQIVSQVMGLDDWESTKLALAEVAWSDGFEGERRLKEIWEDSVFGEPLVFEDGPLDWSAVSSTSTWSDNALIIEA